MSDFPRIELAAAMARHGRLLTDDEICRDRAAMQKALEAYETLGERFCLRVTELYIDIYNLRARLAAIDPEFR